jgi:membrane protease YdiL (CAAX protease family)
MKFSETVSLAKGTSGFAIEPGRVENNGSGWKSIFVGRDGLRAGWRLLMFIAILVILLASFVIVRAGGVHRLVEQQKHAASVTVTPLLLGGSEAIAFALLCAATLILGKIERRKFSVYGLPVRLALRSDFWKGAGCGFAAISGTLLAIYLLHGFSIDRLALRGSAILSSIVLWAIAFLMVGLFEEFLCRGYLQYTLATGIGFWPAALVISGLFGLGHAFNPRETTVGAIAAGLFGLLFCLFLRRTGNLWPAIGFHAAWDWGQTFYGVPDSGIVPYHSVFSSSFHGPIWLTGGTVGPEASIFTPIALLVVAVMFVAWHRAAEA